MSYRQNCAGCGIALRPLGSTEQGEEAASYLFGKIVDRDTREIKAELCWQCTQAHVRQQAKDALTGRKRTLKVNPEALPDPKKETPA